VLTGGTLGLNRPSLVVEQKPPNPDGHYEIPGSQAIYQPRIGPNKAANSGAGQDTQDQRQRYWQVARTRNKTCYGQRSTPDFPHDCLLIGALLTTLNIEILSRL